MINKKIKGATAKSFNGIDFKSQLEVIIYKTLLQEGFKVEYENMKFVIWEGFRPTIPFYDMDKKTRLLKSNMSKLIDITYTPDFTFIYKKHLIIIEAKGYENDTFPIKKKMFRKIIESYNMPIIYFQIYTKKQLMQAIDVIKKL